jgi:hypothetical protein
MHERALNAVFKAIGAWDGEAEAAYDPARNGRPQGRDQGRQALSHPRHLRQARASTTPARASTPSSSRPTTPTGTPRPTPPSRARTPTTRSA